MLTHTRIELFTRRSFVFFERAPFSILQNGADSIKYDHDPDRDVDTVDGPHFTPPLAEETDSQCLPESVRLHSWPRPRPPAPR